MHHLQKLLYVATLAGAAFVLPATAQSMDHAYHDAAPAAAPSAMSTGDVVKIDTAAAKITLRHGPLANLGMPGMTMAFKVADPAMLAQVKQGDKVQFVAERVNGALEITTLQPAN